MTTTFILLENFYDFQLRDYISNGLTLTLTIAVLLIPARTKAVNTNNLRRSTRRKTIKEISLIRDAINDDIKTSNEAISKLSNIDTAIIPYIVQTPPFKSFDDIDDNSMEDVFVNVVESKEETSEDYLKIFDNLLTAVSNLEVYYNDRVGQTQKLHDEFWKHYQKYWDNLDSLVNMAIDLNYSEETINKKNIQKIIKPLAKFDYSRKEPDWNKMIKQVLEPLIDELEEGDYDLELPIFKNTIATISKFNKDDSEFEAFCEDALDYYQDIVKKYEEKLQFLNQFLSVHEKTFFKKRRFLF